MEVGFIFQGIKAKQLVFLWGKKKVCSYSLLFTAHGTHTQQCSSFMNMSAVSEPHDFTDQELRAEPLADLSHEGCCSRTLNFSQLASSHQILSAIAGICLVRD